MNSDVTSSCPGEEKLFGRPLRHWVFAFFAATWIVRCIFLTTPSMMNADEWPMWRAGDPAVASDFINTPNWAEKWEILERVSFGGRIFWIFFHLLWVYAMPNALNGTYALSLVWGLIAMVSLAGAARRLYGERGFLIALMAASASPYLLNYSLRTIGTVQSVSWLCVALYFFTSRRWSLWSWIAGGTCLALSFGAHYGTGSAVVCIAAGLGASVAVRIFRRRLSARERFLKGLLYPVLGATAALLPLLILEFWARHSGGKYFRRLTEHENLTQAGESVSYGEWFGNLGPRGMWLRYLFEFEPTIQAGLIAALGCAAFLPQLSRRAKIGLGSLAILLAGLLISGMGLAIPRAWASILIYLALGIGFAIWMLTGKPESETPSHEFESDAPFGRISMLVSCLCVITLFTSWRNISYMPRHIFAAWPIFFLGFCALILEVFRTRFRRLAIGVLFLSCLTFTQGATGSFITKSKDIRQNVVGRLYPYFSGVFFANLLLDNYGYPSLWNRAPDGDVRILSHSLLLYPASSYDEELFKVLDQQTKMKLNDLDSLASGHAIFNGDILFQTIDREKKTIPPPHVPIWPKEDRGKGEMRFIGVGAKSWTPYEAKIHPYRGLTLAFPPMKKGGVAEIRRNIVLEGEAGMTIPFGFEYMAIGGHLPMDSRLELTVTQDGGTTLGTVNVPANAIASAFNLFNTTTTLTRAATEFSLVARWTTPEGAYVPPMTLYARRPYLLQTPAPIVRTATSGLESVLAYDATFPDFKLPDGTLAPYYFTRLSDGEKGKGLKWKTAPARGVPNEKFVFVATSLNRPNCRITINGEVVDEFRPFGSFLAWESDKYAMQFWPIGSMGGANGVLVLMVKGKLVKKGEPLEIEIRAIPVAGIPPEQQILSAGFGVHLIPNPQERLPK